MNQIELSDFSTVLDTEHNKKSARKLIKKRTEKIGKLLKKMYAQKKHSILIILQGMDASGKDGAMRNLFSNTPPFVIRTKAFKKPTKKELSHDFLWRVHPHAPAKGMLQIFNRSHYEDVLIQYVHDWINDHKRRHRMEAINSFENNLVSDNNTHVMKFYLNISKEQQQKELQERIDEHDKHYKYNAADWEERKYWDEYMSAYEYVLNNSDIPWHIVPVDKRYHRDLVMSEIILNKLQSLDLEWPSLPEQDIKHS